MYSVHTAYGPCAAICTGTRVQGGSCTAKHVRHKHAKRALLPVWPDINGVGFSIHTLILFVTQGIMTQGI